VLGDTVTEVTVGLVGGCDDELHPVNTRNRKTGAKAQMVWNNLKNKGLGRTAASDVIRAEGRVRKDDLVITYERAHTLEE